MARILLITFILFITKGLRANSCCGQSPASFTVLSLEQSLSVTTSYSYIESQGRVFGSGDFYIWDDRKREIQSLQINLASSLAERHQVFVSSALLEGSYSDAQQTGSVRNISDTQIGYTFEVLPEYSFSYWKPIVYLSLLASLPTGNSIYDVSNLSEGADVSGHNQWGAGLGFTLRKVYYPLTITLQGRALKIFAKQFDQIRVSDFYDNSMALLFNYAFQFQSISLNFGITANQLTQRKISPSNTVSGVMESSTVIVGLQRPVGESINIGINYSDQTLIGRARNTLLNRTYSLNINYNYF